MRRLLRLCFVDILLLVSGYLVSAQSVDILQGSDTAICQGSSIQLTAAATGAGPWSFTWSPADSLSDPVIGNPIANPVTSTTYIVTAGNGFVIVRDTIQIRVDTIPQIQVLVADTIACINDTIQLNIDFGPSGFSPTMTYAWSPSFNLSDSTIDNPRAVVSGSINYSVTATDGACSVSDSVVLLGDTCPDLSISDTMICLGEAAELDLQVGSGSFTYQWSPSAGLSDPNIRNPVANPTNSTLYKVTVSTALKDYYEYVMVAVVDTPVVNLGTSDTFVCPNNEFLLSASAPSPVCTDYVINSMGYCPISGIGTPLVLGNSTMTSALPIGFSFDFFCTSYDLFYVSSNGFITFTGGQGHDASEDSLPDVSGARNLIALSWTNLDPSKGVGYIDYFTSGTAPDRKLVVNYRDVELNTTSDRVTAQLILHESTNAIEIHTLYQNFSGETVTVGIENEAETLGFSPPGRNNTVFNVTTPEAWQFVPAAIPPLTYQWSPATFLSDAAIPNPSGRAGNGSIDFAIDVSNGSCRVSDTVHVTVDTGFALIEAFVDTSICEGQPVQIYAVLDSSSADSIQDCMNYEVTVVPFAPTAVFGTSVALADNEVSAAVPIGFEFNFFCNSYRDAYISSNGFITFSPGNPSGCCFNLNPYTISSAIPDLTNPDNLVALFWGNLDPSLGGTVSYSTAGVPGNRRFLVTFQNVPHAAIPLTGFIPGDAVTGQIILYEADHSIELHILTQPTAQANGPLGPYDYHHTLGIENSDGTSGASLPGYDNASWTATNFAVRFSPVMLPKFSGPVTYSWSPGGTLSDSVIIDPIAITNTSEIYVLEASKAGCIISDTINIHVFDTISIVDSIILVSCLGGSDGEAHINVGGGNPPFTYLWSNASTDSFITGLSSGTYTVTVTDAQGCIRQNNAVIVARDSLIFDTLVTNVYCGNAGAIDLIPYGGVSPYSYNWSNGSVTEDIAGLAIGVYTITVTDSVGCLDSLSVAIGLELPMTLDTNVTVVSCLGSTDGAIDIAVLQGVPPYSYQWSSADTTEDLFGLTTGIYALTVTDLLGCRDSILVFVDELPVCCQDIDLNPWNVESDLSQGDWNTSVNGDSVWQDFNGEPTFFVSPDTFENTTVNGYFMVDAGTWDNDYIGFVFGYQSPYAGAGHSNDDYEFLIFDWKRGDQTYGPYFGEEGFTLNRVNGTFNDPINDFRRHFWGHIHQPPKFEVLATQYGAGSGWNPGQIYQFTLNYEPNRIRIYIDGTLIFDVAGTFPPGGFGFYNYSQEDVLYWGFSQPLWAYVEDTTHVTCPGGSDGQIITSASGGNPPYYWEWTNNINNDTLYGDTASNLYAATWTARLADAVGCDISYVIDITEPSIPVLTHDSTWTSCYGFLDGTATISATRGTETFSYLWDDGQTTATATNLASGFHYVTITDASGCLTFDSIMVDEPMPLTVSMDSTDVTCFGANDGSAYATVSGGTAPFGYVWSDGQSTDTAVNLSSGAILLTVTDANACSVIDSIQLSEPSEIILAMDSVDVRCPGGNDGSVTLAVSGGVPGYDYWWSNADTTTGLDSLTTGYYGVTVTDSTGCLVSDSILVDEPPAFGLVIDTTMPACNGDANGSLDLTVTGGTNPYLFQWSSGDTTEDITALVAGTYAFTVTDASNCPDTLSMILTEPTLLTSTTQVVSDYNGAQISINGFADGAAAVVPAGGTAPYTYQWDAAAANQTTDTAHNLSAGIYFVTITDTNGCVVFDSVTVTQPPPLLLGISITTDYNGFSVSCFDYSDADVSASASGGVGPYSFQWSANTGGSTDSMLSGLSAGTYILTVTDANGAIEIDSIEIVQPSPITGNAFGYLLYNGFNISCNGTSTGFAEINPSGGIPTYTYLWSDSQSSNFAVNMIAGTYQVTVTDQNGCPMVDTVTLNEPPPLLLDIDSSGVLLCNSDNNGSVTALPSGGVPGYTFLWSDGQTDAQAINLSAGVYTVTVEDVNTCKASQSVTVNEPSTLDVTLTTTDNVCASGSIGSAVAVPTGGVGNYSLLWSDGQTEDTALNLSAGIYFISVSDSNGCQIIDTARISEPPPITIIADTIDVSCIGYSDGSVRVLPQGGVPPYNYSWFDGSNTDSVSGLSAGSYALSVYDANACALYTDVDIGAPEPFRFNMDVEDVRCYGDQTGRVEATVQGGTQPYAYSWSTGATTSYIDDLSNGVYFLSVVDDHGCEGFVSTLVPEPEPVIIEATKRDPSCRGAENGYGTLAVSGGVPPYRYEWPDGQDQATAENLGSGRYEISVTDDNGCGHSYILELFDPDALVIAFDEPVKEVELGKEIELTPSHNGVSGNLVFEWTPAEGLNCTDCASVIAMPYNSTNYTVSLTDASDNRHPCKAEASVRVDVIEKINIYAPNAFTPNGDGHNDVFTIQGENIANVELQIYNRLGEKLFESHDKGRGWDGTYQGILQNPGVYVYHAKVRFLNGKRKARNGSITLIR